jgi:hypothetical protein
MNVAAPGRPSNEDYCPWGAIASLALYRLYADWQTQGYDVPKVCQYPEIEPSVGGDLAECG